MQKQIAPNGSLHSMCNRRSQGWLFFFEGRYWLRDLLLVALVVLTVTFFLYQPVEVEGTSMQPELANHEYVFVNKIIYHVEPIERGDIIVFHYPLDPSKTFIKRVVGLPGDWISIEDGYVYVNGRLLREPYIPPGYRGHETCAPVHVGLHDYYVLGDHREFSNDSRVWGPVNQKYIYGKAAFAYWPLSDMGLLN